ncbi:hypothetical protein [Limosilactobacillus mucosae]|uniref:Uncharacterized protein n=1 Tax=Limosilactobacillus mucosae TaxID=97478 RepID=A0AAJ1M996_LIMMU|nr:hypothetical protein [Limosilactobacillus mucosae]MDC2828445.1 hypothetical protein [Limosilactobacillus mucosae]MDC2834343.1 hypothetical protein [Limosilactobacillus mucosae]
MGIKRFIKSNNSELLDISVEKDNEKKTKVKSSRDDKAKQVMRLFEEIKQTAPEPKNVEKIDSEVSLDDLVSQEDNHSSEEQSLLKSQIVDLIDKSKLNETIFDTDIANKEIPNTAPELPTTPNMDLPNNRWIQINYSILDELANGKETLMIVRFVMGELELASTSVNKKEMRNTKQLIEQINANIPAGFELVEDRIKSVSQFENTIYLDVKCIPTKIV